MTTTWNATATVTQFEQSANAYAALTLSTGSSPVTQTIAIATSYVAVPDVVLTASAWLSPAFGGSGWLNGKTHAGLTPPPPDDEPGGTRTSASSGCASVGRSRERGSTVVISP